MQRLPPQALYKSAQADFVRVAATLVVRYFFPSGMHPRIVLTVDLDFAQLLAVSAETLPSVILFRLGNENYEAINERLTEVLSQCQQDLEAGAKVFCK